MWFTWCCIIHFIICTTVLLVIFLLKLHTPHNFAISPIFISDLYHFYFLLYGVFLELKKKNPHTNIEYTLYIFKLFCGNTTSNVIHRIQKFCVSTLIRISNQKLTQTMAKASTTPHTYQIKTKLYQTKPTQIRYTKGDNYSSFFRWTKRKKNISNQKLTVRHSCALNNIRIASHPYLSGSY